MKPFPIAHARRVLCALALAVPLVAASPHREGEANAAEFERAVGRHRNRLRLCRSEPSYPGVRAPRRRDAVAVAQEYDAPLIIGR